MLVVFGAVRKGKDYSVRIHPTRFAHSSVNEKEKEEDLNEAMKRFWENEEVQLQPILTEEHQKCVEMQRFFPKSEINTFRL